MKKQLLISLFAVLVSVFCYGKSVSSIVSPSAFTESAVSPSALSFPVDFETGTYTFNDFGGGAATVIANPHSTGINTSAKVVQMIKSAGDPWGGSWFDFGAPIDFSTNKTFTMKVYSPRVGAKVTLKVENASSGAIAFEKEALTTVANAWEEVSFDYSAINVANSYQKIVVIFDNGTVGDGSANFTFLFDDINLITPSSSSDATLKDLKVNGTTIAGFLASTLNYTVALPSGTTVVPAITATTNDAEATAVITAATAIPGTSTVLVTAKDGTTKKTYSVAFVIELILPVTFDDATVNYGLTDFGGNSSAIIVDPENAENHVVKTIKTGTAETWAGTTVGGTIGFANKIPFATGSTKMSVRVWSPAAGTPIRLKVEDAKDNTTTCETEANTTVASAWEFLVFDFSSQATGTAALNLAKTYNKASIFFNFGKTGAQAGEQIYYWDDMYFGAVYTGVKQLNTAKNNVVVYPNPAKNDLYITSKTALQKVEIYSVVGKQVKEYGDVLQSIDISDLKTGVYMIRVIDVNGKIVTSKFIKK